MGSLTYSLRNNGEEAGNDAGCHVGVEARGNSSPYGEAEGDRGEPDEDGQAAKVGGQPNCEEGAACESSQLTDKIVLEGVRGHFPLPVRRNISILAGLPIAESRPCSSDEK